MPFGFSLRRDVFRVTLRTETPDAILDVIDVLGPYQPSAFRVFATALGLIESGNSGYAGHMRR